MPECPTFLKLPARSAKPRSRGITHVLDTGLTPDATRAFLGQAAHLVDIVKVGWGIGYVDPALGPGATCAGARCPVSLGGTLLEVAAMQDRVGELRDWAARHRHHPHRGVQRAARAAGQPQAGPGRGAGADFVVLAETGAKEGNYPPTPAEWAEEMSRDLDAGASWVIAEGRESGTVGLYHADHGVREDLVAAILGLIPQDKVIFEAPAKSQQAWFVRQLGPEVNIGNVAPGQRAVAGNAAARAARGHRRGRRAAMTRHRRLAEPPPNTITRPYRGLSVQEVDVAAHPRPRRRPAAPPRDLPADRVPGAAQRAARPRWWRSGPSRPDPLFSPVAELRVLSGPGRHGVDR